MPFLHRVVSYKSPADVVDGSTNDVRLVEMLGYAKLNGVFSEYAVANEYVASRIAQRLGVLPVPAGVVVEVEGTGQRAWASVAFATDQPAPIDVAEALRHKRVLRVLSGVLIFDVLIANMDRHDGNLRYESKKKQVYAFDHDRSLLGAEEDALGHLKTVRDAFVIDQKNPHRHCLLDHLPSSAEVLRWVDEVETVITKDFVRDVCDDVVGLEVGVTKEVGEALVTFLSYRAGILRTLVRENQEQFKAVPDWGLGI